MSQAIAITLGDPAGIGPEIIAKAFRDAPQVTQGCFVVGDLAAVRRGASFILGPGQTSLPVALISTAAQALQAPPRCISVLPIDTLAALVVPGHIRKSVV